LADVLRNGTRFWAVDKLFMVYVVFSSVLVLGWWNQNTQRCRSIHRAPGWRRAAGLRGEVPQWDKLAFPQLVSAALRRFLLQGNGAADTAVRHTDADQWLANLDFRIWHVNPTVWLERIQTPLLTEFVQTAYTLSSRRCCWWRC